MNLENSSHNGSCFFIFLPSRGIYNPFILYGTYTPHIEHGCARYADYFISEIQKLRTITAPGDLKPILADELREKIHEFFIVTMNGESAGCFRIFHPDSVPQILELGSVVSVQKGVGSNIASYAEHFARENNRSIIAITGGKYDPTLEKHGWKLATESYPKRMNESNLDKQLWIYPNL